MSQRDPRKQRPGRAGDPAANRGDERRGPETRQRLPSKSLALPHHERVGGGAAPIGANVPRLAGRLGGPDTPGGRRNLAADVTVGWSNPRKGPSSARPSAIPPAATPLVGGLLGPASRQPPPTRRLRVSGWAVREVPEGVVAPVCHALWTLVSRGGVAVHPCGEGGFCELSRNEASPSRGVWAARGGEPSR